jgi:hypothetical protein
VSHLDLGKEGHPAKLLVSLHLQLWAHTGLTHAPVVGQGGRLGLNHLRQPLHKGLGGAGNSKQHIITRYDC